MSRAERRRALRIPKDHGWKTSDGYKIVLADRGAVRFDVPRDWHVQPGEDCDIVATDRPPPDDDCKAQMSLLQVPRLKPGMGPPLGAMLSELGEPPEMEVTAVFQPVLEPCEGAELAWMETHFVEDGRDAISRTVLARGGGRHAVISMVLWSDDRERFEPAWRELLRSVEVGKSYDLSGRDPRRN